MGLASKLENMEAMEGMASSARSASNLLKALSHESRLMILCILATGEKSVGEIQEIMDLRQPSVSQQLVRLRLDGIVSSRRDGRTIYYSIANEEAKRVVELMYDMYCAT